MNKLPDSIYVDGSYSTTRENKFSEKNKEHRTPYHRGDRVEALISALSEITLGRGAYAHDQLQHADNCIRDMKKIAVEAIAAWVAE